jgi:hypothetical protein
MKIRKSIGSPVRIAICALAIIGASAAIADDDYAENVPGMQPGYFCISVASFLRARRFQDVAHGIVAFVTGRLEHPFF